MDCERPMDEGGGHCSPTSRDQGRSLTDGSRSRRRLRSPSQPGPLAADLAHTCYVHPARACCVGAASAHWICDLGATSSSAKAQGAGSDGTHSADAGSTPHSHSCIALPVRMRLVHEYDALAAGTTGGRAIIPLQRSYAWRSVGHADMLMRA